MAIAEICAGSLNSAVAAFRGGAHRIELCDNLYEGGTTPSKGCLTAVRQLVDIPVNVLIRPRGGDFCYNKNEFYAIQEDIRLCKELEMNGIVIGVLKEDGEIDIDRMAELVELARPLSLTFHRAFDMVPDPFRSLKEIISLGFDRILTSGQKGNAIEGSSIIRELIKMAGGEIIILPGGGLNVDNIAGFASAVGADEYHATCRSAGKSPMQYRNPLVTMGGLTQIPEYDILETDPVKVQKFVSLIK